jgi:hypothetical protein
MSKNHPIGRFEFYVTSLISLLVILAGLYQARLNISEMRSQNCKNSASSVLKDVSEKTNRICEQLDRQASMYLEIGRCYQKARGGSTDCLNREYAFRPEDSQRAWSDLDIAVYTVCPIVWSNDAKELVLGFLKVGESHSRRMRPLLCPATAEATQEIVNEIQKTKAELLELKGELIKKLPG